MYLLQVLEYSDVCGLGQRQLLVISFTFCCWLVEYPNTGHTPVAECGGILDTHCWNTGRLMFLSMQY